MTKQFHITEKAALPRLAWCARVARGTQDVIVDCGKWVEGDAGFFCEGAWSGDYRLRDFPEALTFSGSGAVIRQDEVLFCAPTHTLQALYLLKQANEVICSNSLAFLLQQCTDDIDSRYKAYDFDVMSIMFGLKDYTKHIPTRAGNRIHLYYHCNLVVTHNLEVLQQPKPLPEAFRDYESYRGFLQEEVNTVASNATSTERKIRYTPLATVSSGYDSPACAVLGKAAGCTQAVTFGAARSGEDDSGRQIGEALGLAVTEFDSQAYMRRTDCAEAEFLATGYGGDDLIMAALEEELPAKLLLTGYHGDKIWSRDAKAGPYIVRGDPSGASLGEFRLRVGFLNLPVPFIGCTQHESIKQISNSAMMRPWSVENIHYDRPIPRRIAEEAGIPRHLFGQKKKAIARPYQTTSARNPDLARVLSPAAYQDFCSDAETKPLFRNSVEHVGFVVLHTLYRFNLRLVQSVKLAALIRALGITPPTKPVISWKYSKSRTKHCLVFDWGFARIKARYRPDKP